MHILVSFLHNIIYFVRIFQQFPLYLHIDDVDEHNKKEINMKNKNLILRLFAILFIAQIFDVCELKAERIDVSIPAQTHERKWGTINIPAQTIALEDDDDENDYKSFRHLYFTITNIPEGFGFYGLCSQTGNIIINNDQVKNGEMSYYDYLNINDRDVIAEPLPIKSPKNLVNVINGFVPDGATLNSKGEVVILKEVNQPHYTTHTWGEFETGKKVWQIQTDVTMVKGNENAGVGGFYFDIKDSHITFINSAISTDYFNISNSTIGFCVTPELNSSLNFGTVKTEGNVVFKGIPYTEKQFGNLCETSRPTLAFSQLINDAEETGISTISFEDLDIHCYNNAIVSSSQTLNFKNCIIDTYSSYEGVDDMFIIQGGNVNIDSCLFSPFRPDPPAIIMESGKMQIKYSNIAANISVKGDKANVEINKGILEGLTIDKGKVTVNNGNFPNGITVNGGELKVNNGTIPSLNVMKEDCKIELNNGRFKSVYMPIEVKKPILSLLGPNAGYYDRDGTYMPFKLVDIEGVEQKEGAIVTGVVYPVSFVISNYGSTPSATYEAAQKADVGTNGKDIRVRENGDLEIWTPEGLAWLAFVQSDTHNRVLTGREYFAKSKDWYLMADLDMDGYGTGWPNLKVSGRTFYGQQHRIYNMNILRPDASFFYEIGFYGVVRDLIVEGSVTNQEDEGGRDIDGEISYVVAGFAIRNNGLIVNCAFKGSVWNTVVGLSVSIGGFVCINNLGRIENCYAAPCGQLIGGVRNADDAPSINELLCYNENYSIGGFALISYADLMKEENQDEGDFIENCYFGGQTVYNVPQSNTIYTEIRQGICTPDEKTFEHIYFLDADISAETLNKNALEHKPDMYEGKTYPYVEWAKWAESDDKQCGRPYFVWEKNIDDTPSSINGVEVQGGFKAWSKDGMLCFSTDGKTNVLVYSASGKLCARYAAQAGTKHIALSKGLYIVTYGNESKKVVLQ